MRAIQLGLIDAGSCTRSLSVLLLAAEIGVRDSLTLTLTLTLEIAQEASAAIICTCICALQVQATATI